MRSGDCCVAIGSSGTGLRSSPSTPFHLGSALPTHSCHGCCAAVEGESVPTTALSMRNKLREQKAWNSLNQLISLCDEERRHFETKRFSGLEIDHQLELRRLLDG